LRLSLVLIIKRVQTCQKTERDGEILSQLHHRLYLADGKKEEEEAMQYTYAKRKSPAGKFIFFQERTANVGRQCGAALSHTMYIATVATVIARTR